MFVDLHVFVSPLVPPPTVSLTDANVTLGSNATLMCMVILQNYSSYSSISVTVTVDLLNDSMVLMTNSIPTGSDSTRTSEFTISDVSVFTAGQYQCRATVSTSVNNVMNSVTSNSPNASITVQSKWFIELLNPWPKLCMYSIQF